MDIHFDDIQSILFVKPNGPLSEDNFVQLNAVLDPYLQQHAFLKGVVIETASFPGWKNVSGLIAHIRFIKNHHQKIQKIALVTQSKFAEIAPTCIAPFVHPKIKHFQYDQKELAIKWIGET